tara:strand:+ start:166 stop:333 length:168 start_codon:yes stop_codon:yes gene_type:complete
MEEVIVEGLDFEDFVTLKQILANNTSFRYGESQLHADTSILIEKIDKILQVFDDE